jgi:hypothetical protein
MVMETDWKHQFGNTLIGFSLGTMLQGAGRQVCCYGQMGPLAGMFEY